jgi:hypothetical protein
VNTRYTAQAVGFEIIEADETKGTAPRIKVTLRVTEGPDAGKDLFYYGSLHENAQQYTVDALRAMGWSCNDITTLEGLGDLKVHAVEKVREYNGKPQTSWMIFPVKTPAPRLEADNKAAFAARFKALAASAPAVARTEMNAGLPVDALPAPIAPRNGANTAADSGPAVGGQPF